MKTVAVIGLGNISNRHRENIRSLIPNATIIAVSNRETSQITNVKNADIVLNNFKDLYDFSIDFAIVASPATFHIAHSEYLLKGDIPVLVEKPLSVDVESTRKFISLCKTAKVPAAVGYCLRYLKSAIEMKRLAAERYCGEIHNVAIEVGQFLPTWRESVDYRKSVSAQRNLGGGVLNELSHEIDYAHWIFGDLKARYSSLRSSKELALEVEDQASIVATTSNDTELTLKLDFLQKSPTRFCKVVGSNCTIVWNLLRDEILRLDDSGSTLIFAGGGVANPNQKYLDMFEDFLKLVEGAPNECVRPKDALKTVRFIEDCRSLARKWSLM